MGFSIFQRTVPALITLLMLFGYSGASAQTYSPDFSITLNDFQTKALTAKEEVWVIDFWATWCGPCIQAIPHMKETHAAYQAKGVKFISISWDRNEQQWMAGLERFQMPWSHIIVPKGKEAWLEKNFPHKGIPTAFVINNQGKAKRVNDVYDLGKYLDKALAN